MPEQEKGGSKAKPVTALVNNRKVSLPDDHETGAAIKQAAGVPAAFQLFDEKGHVVDNAKEIRVHDGDKFTAVSGQDVS